MKKSSKIRWIVLSTICLVLLSITEFVLRHYGFCDAVLMRKDAYYEYIAIPQERNRFGRRIYYNKFSQRSKELSKNDKFVIAAFGDSFINGGTTTDHDSLATTKFENHLNAHCGNGYRMLNISAGSWGPDNCYAYLSRHGVFNAKKIILFVSSHDAFDNMQFEDIVGKDISMPTKQYHFAIHELFSRYALPKLKEKLGYSEGEQLHINKQTVVNPVFNNGFENFYYYTKMNGLAFQVYLHADREETRAGSYTDQGRSIIAFCKKRNIPIIEEIQYKLPMSVYRDNIHFNDEGQDSVNSILKRTLSVCDK